MSLNDEAKTEDLDARIEYWHTHDTGVTLREYLGLTCDEYEEWGKGTPFHEIVKHRLK